MKRGTPDHPKTLHLQALLDIEISHACGILELMWHFAGKYAPRGDIGKWPPKTIANACGTAIDPERLIGALVESRWLDSKAGQPLLVHDWPEHCEDSIHMALARKCEFFADGTKPKLTRLGSDERREIEQTYNVKKSKPSVTSRRKRVHTGNAQETHTERTAPPPENALPSPAKPSPAQPSQASSCSESDEPTSEPPVMVFPCVGEGLPEFALGQSKLDEYQQSYPGINALAECRKALQWCRDNPTRRKTYAGMTKFLNNWLARAQDGGGTVSRHVPGAVEVQQL